MSHIEGILIFRALLVLVMLGVLLLSFRRVVPVLGVKLYAMVIGAFGVLFSAQIIQYFQYSPNHTYNLTYQLVLSVGLFLLVTVIALTLRKSIVVINRNITISKRERWLREVYKNIPAGVFVLKDNKVIYHNDMFAQLQSLHGRINPFSDCDKDQQDIWLTTPNAKKYAYWVAKFSLGNDEGTAFIVNDITSVKLHESFIKKIGIDLTDHGVAAVNLVLDTFYKFLPEGLIYVGQYKNEENCYKYLEHRGSDKGINIYEDLHMLIPNIEHNKWVWLQKEEIESLPRGSFISQFQASNFGCVILSDARNTPMGVIIVLLNNDEPINDLLIDFLSIASIRIRSELEYSINQKMILRSNNQYRAFISRSNEAIIDASLVPAVLTDIPVEKQLESIVNAAIIKEVNPEFKRLFEVSDHCEISDLVAIKSLKHVINYVLSSGFSSERIEVVHETSTGEIKWISCRCMNEIEDGRLKRLWLIIQDITESKMHIQDLEYKTRHDALTGLPNRTALRDTIVSSIDQGMQFGFKVGLLLIDLDRFKEINDALGHQYGDVLLKKIEPRIKPLLNKYRAKLSRLGGDEFAVTMPSIQSEKEARKLASDIIESIKEPFDLGQLNVEISCSIGISIFPEDGVDGDTLLRCADVAMYKAKSSPGGIVNYRDDIDNSSPRRLSIMASMATGLKSNQFYLCFQPKVNLKDDKVKSCEALIRWDHPELGSLNPGEFIPLAEMNDSIILITEWVIDNALQNIKNWMADGLEIKVSVNVSTRNLLDENLIAFISNKLIEYSVPAHLLEIEITESSLMADPEGALETLNNISALGVSISVDDFGTGYSSLVYLRQLPIDTLKVDITFVRNMCHNEQDSIIVNSIIQLAHNLSLSVVAEGAEDKQTVDALDAMDCDDVQGFYFSKPVKAEAFTDFCKNWAS